MAWSFGDSFDLYAATADLIAGYWDSGSTVAFALVAGRFAGSQAINMNTSGALLTKSSAVNDAVHHIVCAFRQTAVLSGSTLGAFFELFDGATAQCSIVFRSDGAILLTSGGPTGGALATYTGAVTAQNVWFAFEFEVVINNATGSFAVRKNGNTSNDFSATGLNTRAASTQTVVTVTGTAATGANTAIGAPFTAQSAGAITGGTININTGVTGHIKIALYDAAMNLVANSSATPITNPTTGLNTFTFPTPPSLVQGATYYLAYDYDIAITGNTGQSTAALTLAATSYASFPVSSLAGATTGTVNAPGLTLNFANNYANKLTLSMQGSVSAQQIDDLFWRSDASSVAWMGDIRCYTRMPASDQSVTFSKFPATNVQTPVATSTTSAVTAGTARYTAFTAAYDGTIAAATVSFGAGYTGNLKCSIFASPASVPTTVLGSATVVTNPIAGPNTITFGTPVAVTRGTQYWIGFDSDTTSGTWSVGGGLGAWSSTTPYASFPVASPSTSAIAPVVCSLTITLSDNAQLVNEAQQDGATTYVYDSTPGDADSYALAPLGVTPVAVIATTARAYAQKNDAGWRTAAVQLKSGGTTVASPTLSLAVNSFQWTFRTDAVDPNTGSPWLASNVDAALIGPTVVA